MARACGLRVRAHVDNGRRSSPAVVHRSDRDLSRWRMVFRRGHPRLPLYAAVPGDASTDGEAILFGQAGRIDQSLAAIGRDASPKPKSFFLGFAGVGEQKVFAQEIGLASRVLAERYDITGRSVSLINDERDLERAPLA